MVTLCEYQLQFPCSQQWMMPILRFDKNIDSITVDHINICHHFAVERNNENKSLSSLYVIHKLFNIPKVEIYRNR